MARAGAEVVRSSATEDPEVRGSVDYADCFEVSLDGPDHRPPLLWARAALEGMPPVLRAVVLVAHRRVLRLRLGPLAAEDHVLGWRVVESREDLVRLEADGPLIHGVLVGRRTGPTTVVLRTFVRFRRARLARATWTVVGPVHRRVAPYLLARAARTGPGR